MWPWLAGRADQASPGRGPRQTAWERSTNFISCCCLSPVTLLGGLGASRWEVRRRQTGRGNHKDISGAHQKPRIPGFPVFPAPEFRSSWFYLYHYCGPPGFPCTGILGLPVFPAPEFWASQFPLYWSSACQWLSTLIRCWCPGTSRSADSMGNLRVLKLNSNKFVKL